MPIKIPSVFLLFPKPKAFLSVFVYFPKSLQYNRWGFFFPQRFLAFSLITLICAFWLRSVAQVFKSLQKMLFVPVITFQKRLNVGP